MAENRASLVLNVARITFVDTAVPVTKVYLPTPEAFSEIETSIRGTHFLRRVDDSGAVAIPIVENAPVVAGTAASLKLSSRLTGS